MHEVDAQLLTQNTALESLLTQGRIQLANVTFLRDQYSISWTLRIEKQLVNPRIAWVRPSDAASVSSLGDEMSRDRRRVTVRNRSLRAIRVSVLLSVTRFRCHVNRQKRLNCGLHSEYQTATSSGQSVFSASMSRLKRVIHWHVVCLLGAGVG